MPRIALRRRYDSNGREGRKDVDAQGNVQWLYIWKAEVFAWSVIKRMAPDDNIFMATLRLPVESQRVVQRVTKNPRIPAENNQ